MTNAQHSSLPFSLSVRVNLTGKMPNEINRLRREFSEKLLNFKVRDVSSQPSEYLTKPYFTHASP